MSAKAKKDISKLFVSLGDDKDLNKVLDEV